MLRIPQLAPYALVILLPLAASCSTFSSTSRAMSNDPTVVAMEQEVAQQKQLVEQTKQEARRAEDLLDAKESRLKAAKHGVKADRALN